MTQLRRNKKNLLGYNVHMAMAISLVADNHEPLLGAISKEFFPNSEHALSDIVIPNKQPLQQTDTDKIDYAQILLKEADMSNINEPYIMDIKLTLTAIESLIESTQEDFSWLSHNDDLF